MTVSAKCYDAIRAIYALAKHRSSTPLTTSAITEEQDVVSTDVVWLSDSQTPDP
jgi:hypothetical protein